MILATVIGERSMTKKDLTQFCRETNETHHSVSEEEFRGVWCRRCRNQECRHSQWGKGVWLERMSTQVDRLLDNPQFGDPQDPDFGFLNFDFEDMKRQAIAIHISEQNNDWEIPSEKQISDFNKDGLREDANSVKRVSRLSETKDENIKDETEVTESEKPEGSGSENNYEPLVQTPLNLPSVSNTKTKDEGIMLGEPLVEKNAVIDDWSVPVSTDNIIPVGGKIVLGGKKK